MSKIVRIDEERCTGCGACVTACEEGAIAMVNGKARLVREDFCDGLGKCLPACPADAISFEERPSDLHVPMAVACEGSQTKNVIGKNGSELAQWPVQLRLVPAGASFLKGADLLVAADCTAYAYGRFQEDFVKGRRIVVACPKLDPPDISQKLAEIIRAGVRSITVVRMEVPCCGGIVRAVHKAVADSGCNLPVSVTTITSDGLVKVPTGQM